MLVQRKEDSAMWNIGCLLGMADEGISGELLGGLGHYYFGEETFYFSVINVGTAFLLYVSILSLIWVYTEF